MDTEAMIQLTKALKDLGVYKFCIADGSVEFFGPSKPMVIPLDQLPKSDEELKKEQDELLYWSSGGKQ
jgi:hypothetical protein